MADDEGRTEAPTGRRLERARAGGRAPLSREVAGAAVLGAAALVLGSTMPVVLPLIGRELRHLLADSHQLSPAEAMAVATHACLLAAGPFALAAPVAAAAATFLQTGFLIHLEAAWPDLSRLDIRRGLRRIAGADTLLEAGKALVKLVLIGWAGWRVLDALWPVFGRAMLWEPGQLLSRMAHEIGRLLLAMVGAQALLAGADVARARLKHVRSLRMSRQELREEHKESEGDPRIKARIKALRRQRARQRMMDAVPKATVVVTNPTHYAVALVYDRGGGGAPRVVAKGVDATAARIREVARQYRVPVVANPPLARALHRLELEAQIPTEHFRAVAELIAYVWRLRERRPGAL